MAKCRCLDISALRTVILKHVLPSTPLSFKVERILNCPNLRQHGCQHSWVDFCMVVLLSYFTDCEMQASVEDWIRTAIKIFTFLFIIPLFTMALQSLLWPRVVLRDYHSGLVFILVLVKEKKMCPWVSRKAQILWINSKSESHRTCVLFYNMEEFPFEILLI